MLARGCARQGQSTRRGLSSTFGERALLQDIITPAACSRGGVRDIQMAEVRRAFVGQCKKGDCCLEDGHAGSCDDGNMSDVEYEVECITKEEATATGEREFLVKWKRWPIEDSTWESEANLQGAKEVSARSQPEPQP